MRLLFDEELLLLELPLALRVLLLELELLRLTLLLPLRLLAELLVVPLGRLLLELFPTRLLELLLPVRPVVELLLVPLGRLLEFGRPTLLPLFGVLPLLDPLLLGLLGFTLPPLLFGAGGLPPLWLLPLLMLPPLAFGLTVAVGAGVLLLGFGSGLLFHSCVAG